ncbi:54S ribosomal protein L2, mitochondrial [Cyphellophora attinorum]|uniref:Large ribosomal subunit protein bL27m n=1 Tax=Cyphellophora attinorum TaxID=1664694 RepID=A0A0N0NK75_9EURO|nr:54S ribosomal protein L2, mitochondrial [Phialophora attinorum]KPI37821.1 54S ribosomal protein L2, mitochondrial [Phialophora attinorum]
MCNLSSFKPAKSQNSLLPPALHLPIVSSLTAFSELPQLLNNNASTTVTSFTLILVHLSTSLSSLTIHQLIPVTPKTQVRHAQHASQGRANGPSDSAGRRLGLKKGNTEHVIPGNIIFKQRGTKWHPGENGYVRYYRNPAAHPTRRYIGVALAREGKESVLPSPRNAPTRRRVGMLAVPIKVAETAEEARGFLEQHAVGGSGPAGPDGSPRPVGHAAPGTPVKPAPIMRYKGYRIANVQLARDAVDEQVQVRPFDRKDRWKAWRVRALKFKNKRHSRATRAAGKLGKTKGGTRAPAKGTKRPAKR